VHDYAVWSVLQKRDYRTKISVGRRRTETTHQQQVGRS